MSMHRVLQGIHQGRDTQDGAGVRIKRVFSANQAELFDPFLMLDEFGSENPDDYVAGFPAHPHRGFETVTIMLNGKMQHQDHLGNVGLLADNGVQWMTAGRGIIHSEMPQQRNGWMRGVQLWLNLPAKDKMQPAGYQDFAPEDIAQLVREDGTCIRVVAGTYRDAEHQLSGQVQRDDGTQVQLYDIQLTANAQIAPRVADGLRVLIHVLEGEITVGAEQQPIRAGQLARFAERGDLFLHSNNGARLLVLAGRPLQEPIVHYGPFVMNSKEQIEQAIMDFRSGRLTA